MQPAPFQETWETISARTIAEASAGLFTIAQHLANKQISLKDKRRLRSEKGHLEDLIARHSPLPIAKPQRVFVKKTELVPVQQSVAQKHYASDMAYVARKKAAQAAKTKGAIAGLLAPDAAVKAFVAKHAK